ncbi:MAG: hypothetical protein ACUVSC_01810 [Candidatus Fervidibacter sp.]|uniref:hypothetical protein n=1 Tax=Candidatus Fervidibacter sp. TaxID=3100871 RepID=UPI004049E2B2
MTAELHSEQATGFDPDPERRKRAGLLVLHNAIQALWNEGEGKRTKDLSVIDGFEIFIGLTRQILFKCEHLVLQRKIWDFRWRQEAKSAPLGGLVTKILTLKGIPLRPEEIASILAPWRHQPVDVLEKAISSFLMSRSGNSFFTIDDGRYGLSEWLPQIEGLSVDEAISQAFWQREQFAEWLLSLVDRKPDPSETAKAILDAAQMPLSHSELLFTLWAKSSGQLELLSTLTQLLNAEGLQVLSLGYWVTEEGKERAMELLLQQSEELRQQIQQRAKFIEAKKLQQLLSSTEVLTTDLEPEVADEVASWLETQPYPASLLKIAEQVLEVLPTDPDYEQSLRSLFALLSKEDRFVNFGGQFWWLKSKFPSHISEVPSVLIPPPPALPEDLSGQVDLVLPVEAIDNDLRRFVEDPYYEEVGEEEAVLLEEPKPSKRIDIAVTFPHLQAGTLKIRRIDIPFFQSSPPVQFLRVTDDTQNELVLWVNLSIGLCFGLSEWYQERKVGVGGIARLERAKSGSVKLIWTGRYDKWLHIPNPRLNELLQFAAHETVRKAPSITLVQSILTQHPQGVHFLRLWSELNVLRRTTKTMLASILCAYPMFARVPNMDGFWTLDFTKLTEGIRPEKLAYLSRTQ